MAAALLLLTGHVVLAQPPPSARSEPAAASRAGAAQQALRAKLNQETLVVAAGRPSTSYMAMATDLAAAVGASGGLRLLPIAGDGGTASLQDLLFLRSVDLAIVPANVLAHAKATNAFGGALPQRIAYVTALYGEGVHLVAGRDIGMLSDLRGKLVAVPAGDGMAEFTATDIFRHLGLAVEAVPMDPLAALEEMRAGKIAAVMLVGGKPLAHVSALPKDGSLRLLSLPFEALPGEGYVPAVFFPEDYPALIPPGGIVETVAVGAILMVGRGSDEGTRRVARHTPALLETISALASAEQHSKWKDVNIGAVLPGWSRIDAAERWLNEAAAQRKQQMKGASDATRALKHVRSTGGSAPPAGKQLFDEFDAWARQGGWPD